MLDAITALSPTPTPGDLFRFSPSRRPDSRYQRALELVNHRPRPLRCKWWDDQSVRTMRTYMLGQRHRNARKRRALAAEFAAQATALTIYQQSDPDLRIDLECRILAGQCDTDIADRLGITPETVATYESLFFSVRDRLKYTQWMHSVVLDSERRKPMSELERLMKALAYAAGPSGVDVLLARDPAQREKIRKVAELADKFNKALAGEYSAAQKAELDRLLQTE